LKKIITLLILFSTSFFLTVQIKPQTRLFNPFEENIGVVIGDKVFVRERPEASSPVIDKIFEDDYVKIIDQTSNEFTIGNFKDKWLKVKTKNDKEGWAFGYYIFNLKNLFNPTYKWAHPGVVDCMHKLILSRDKSCEYIFLCCCPGRERKWKGKFEINGKMLEFSNVPIFRYLYLYKTPNIPELIRGSTSGSDNSLHLLLKKPLKIEEWVKVEEMRNPESAGGGAANFFYQI